MRKIIGVMDNGAVSTFPHDNAVIPIRTAQSKASIEMQLGELQIKFNENPDAEQLTVLLTALMVPIRRYVKGAYAKLYRLPRYGSQRPTKRHRRTRRCSTRDTVIRSVQQKLVSVLR